MPASYQNKTILRSKDARLKKLRGEAVLLHMGTGDYFSLNNTGVFLWESCATLKNFGELSDALCKKFGLEPSRGVEDVSAFLTDLLEHRLIELLDDHP